MDGVQYSLQKIVQQIDFFKAKLLVRIDFAKHLINIFNSLIHFTKRIVLECDSLLEQLIQSDTIHANLITILYSCRSQALSAEISQALLNFVTILLKISVGNSRERLHWAIKDYLHTRSVYFVCITRIMLLVFCVDFCRSFLRQKNCIRCL